MRNESAGSRRPEAKRARVHGVAGVTLAVAALASAVAIGSASGTASSSGWEAVAVLRDTAGNRVGKVKFEGDKRGTVVKANLHGVTVGLDGYHGFHLHANDTGGPCDPLATAGPFTNVGGHWNPTLLDHGSHAGDLPSIQVLLDGTGEARSVTGRFDPADIGGRAVILHAGPDNFGNVPSRYATGEPPVAGPDAATKGTGDAGGRIACGIIELD
jgi:superoxide dismutase, Cu-Zn family